ncbi:DNA polymerase IV [Novosphingobium resinovorum]|uniref:DNA polymerase IV n=1 Tax=Novosphingobium resinovorum TaxID=158500 RepID=A0A031JTU1_9SPHN|nr:MULTISPECIES: DNA polymerase IV [Sphingomonadaceae]EJU12862.1 DNA polymerase IV [Sphingomonas sp. LH128]EZP80340.1 DNA polymerase IV [Novosphingobium resinovorum]MBF7012335.1 DNA polymerase IV [Novosphingobium sp. HR1a]WJM27076.1 DNA polymerase IV [Novosphingobium resinovorum]
MFSQDDHRPGSGEDEADGLRKIIHVDMDAFYASVEQRDDPSIRGLPVAVGGSSGRGVVAAASYEARKFGVRSAMPSARAVRLCPDLVFRKPRFEVYREVSQQIRAIFLDYTPHVEPLSLDEAYLDVTADLKGIGSATRIAQEIRRRIKADTRLTASAGVSYNKFLAKLASDQNKPDGLCVIRPGEGAQFVAGLPVRRFHGVGPRGAEKMARLGIETGADLAGKDLAFLRANFGSFAEYLFRAARGVDLRQVRADRPRKSVGGERTFFENIEDPVALRETMDHIVDTVWERIERSGARGRTVTMKLRYADFQTLTRARSLHHFVADKAEFSAIGHALLEDHLPLPQPIRLMGLTLSALEQREEDARPAKDGQLSLL